MIPDSVLHYGVVNAADKYVGQQSGLLYGLSSDLVR